MHETLVVKQALLASEAIHHLLLTDAIGSGRISNFTIESVTEIEPRELPQQEQPEPEGSDEGGSTDADAPTADGISQQQVMDRLTGQQRLFDD